VSAPFATTWTGTGFDVLRRDVKRADAELVIGERYAVEIEEERSAASHRHYFATVRELWLNLPERLTDEFPSSEALRKRALILAGYRDERTLVCQSRAEALRVAAFLRPVDDFAVISVAGATVVMLTAKSQSQRAMGKKVFEESKTAVLDALAKLIGVDPKDAPAEAA
jgi:hypothetical protein